MNQGVIGGLRRKAAGVARGGVPSVRAAHLVLMLAAATSVAPMPVAAQPGVQGERGRGGRSQDSRGGDDRKRDGRSQEERAEMERRVEARINAIIRTRLGLNDEQFNQLRAVSARVESERRALRRDEIGTRGELRRLLLAPEPVNEARISDLLDQLPRLERRRIEMMEQEQRELARFLAPSQRARYFALQDELRRNLQESQRRRLVAPGSGDDRSGGRGSGSPGRPPRPPAQR